MTRPTWRPANRSRLLDLGLVRKQHVRDKLAHHRLGQGAGPLDRDSLGQGAAAGSGRPVVQGLEHGGIHRGLHADDLDLGLEALRRDGVARNEPAPADGDDQDLQLGLCRQHFERDRPLSRNDRGIVVRVDEGKPLLGRPLLGEVRRFSEMGAVKDDPGAEAARLLNLGERRVRRHHDRGHDAKVAAVVGDALGVVARRGGDHAGPHLRILKPVQLVVGAAVLERARVLQVLELEIHLGAERFRELWCGNQRRLDDHAREDFGCGADVVDGDGHRACSAK
jgi:hypothetical protein